MRSGSFDVPADFDPAATVLDSLARTPWTHDVSLRIRGSEGHIRGHLPASIATVTTSDKGTDWVQVRIRAERLDWIPPVLAALDRPFVVERPAALRDLVRALARRLDEYATDDSS